MKNRHEKFSFNILVKLYFGWLIFIFFATEILSYFELLTRPFLLLSNILFFLVLSLWLVYYFGLSRLNRDLTRIRLSFIRFWSPSTQRQSPKHNNWYAVIIGVLLTFTFVQGLFSAPSTTDAMTYQINRTMYWMQEQTVYQEVLRNSHDFMPPFASYILMHLYMIFRGDMMLFFSQWVAYAVSIFLSGMVTGQLGASKKLQQYTMLAVATIPIIVLQATSTQADMVTAAITLLAFHLSLGLLKNPSFLKAALLGVALGLGMNVKASFYIFAIVPLSLFFLLLAKNPKRAVVTGAIVLAIALAMNLRYYSQNMRLYGNPLGQKFQGKGNTYVNERFDPPAIASNLIKNTMNNIPVPLFTDQVQSAVVAFHNTMGIDIIDPRASYIGLDFKVAPVLYPQEDLAASPLNILLIILAGFFVFRKSFEHDKKTELRVLYVFLGISYVIFATILKYESVHNRLLATFLLIGTIIATLVLSGHRVGLNIIKLFIFLSVPLAFILIFFNVQHPYISYKLFYDKVKPFAGSYHILPEAFYEKPRIKQYFNSRPYWYQPYDKVTNLIAAEGKNQIITIELMDDEFEYPLWAMLKVKGVNFYVQQNKFVDQPIQKKAIILTTSEKPFEKAGYKTRCFKTDIEYGYACLSKRGTF